MFCSKCGKEIADGSAFCSACGNPTAFNQAQVNLRSGMNMNTPDAGMTNEEKTKKLAAVWSFILVSLAELFMAWSICVSEGRILFGSDMPDRILSRWWEDNSWLFVLAGFFLTFDVLINIFIFYVVPYVNRIFEKTKKNIIIQYIFKVVIFTFLPLIFAAGIDETLDIFSAWLVLFGLFVAVLYAVALIAYCKAANCERLEKFGVEVKDHAPNVSNLTEDNTDAPKDFWICPKCSSHNSSAQSQCKDCGYYK